MKLNRRRIIGSGLATLAVAASRAGLPCRVAAQASSEPGVTATEIHLGGTYPLSGSASAYAVIATGATAFFASINDGGGVNGRKIVFTVVDDGYNPAQTVQLTRQLVERDRVFAIFNSVGTAHNMAIRPYLNEHEVPQLFVSTGATTWGADYQRFPWTIGWQPSYQAEAIIYAKQLVASNPSPKIGVLYQNDDYGLDYIRGLKRGLGSKQTAIVKMAGYEVTDADVKSQVASLKSAGADVVFLFATPKFATQALVSIAQLSWRPVIYLNNVSSSQTTMRAASQQGGSAATSGVLTTLYLKDPSEERWAKDAGMARFRQIMATYASRADASDLYCIYGVAIAFTMADALRRCGRDLTRRKLMDAVVHLDERDNPFVLPGIVVKTTPQQRFPVAQSQVQRYESGGWSPLGQIVDVRNSL